MSYDAQSVKLWVAIDTSCLTEAKALAEQLSIPGVGLKFGHIFFLANGPEAIRAIKQSVPDTPIFLDLKLHDIPNTVDGAIHSVMSLEPAIITLHASGGKTMMETAVKAATIAAGACRVARPKLIASTVMTSLDDTNLQQIGVAGSAEQQVIRLATLAMESGLEGVVCSAKEVDDIRTAIGMDMVLMVPGIRPTCGTFEADDHHHEKVTSPKEAMEMGASCIVVGRPITKAADPRKAAQDMLAEIGLNYHTQLG